MAYIIKFIDFINTIVKVTVSAMLAIMSVLIVLQVIFRYILESSLPWSEEISRYLMVYIVFFGAALSLRYRQMIAIEFIGERLPKGIRKYLNIFVLVICIVFFSVLFKVGLDITQQVHMQLAASTRIPMSIPYAAIPIGALLLLFNSVGVILEEMQGKKDGEF
ncbi:TRAP transporter small permease [Robertmurraya massiliosenegalensis]|uniref:TRAP transporter small permease n=1 Tax=Robertmurraya TaxID=2837507 RepID=UPI0039A46DEE